MFGDSPFGDRSFGLFRLSCLLISALSFCSFLSRLAKYSLIMVLTFSPISPKVWFPVTSSIFVMSYSLTVFTLRVLSRDFTTSSIQLFKIPGVTVSGFRLTLRPRHCSIILIRVLRSEASSLENSKILSS